MIGLCLPPIVSRAPSVPVGRSPEGRTCRVVRPLNDDGRADLDQFRAKNLFPDGQMQVFLPNILTPHFPWL